MTELETLQFVYQVIESEEKRYIELNKNQPDVLNDNECELLLDNLSNLRHTLRKEHIGFEKKFKTEEQVHKYRYYIADFYSTGEPSVVSILIVDDNYTEEYIRYIIRESFDYYYTGSIKEVDYDTIMDYQNYIPEFVHKVIHGKVMKPNVFKWYGQVTLNY